MQRKLSRILALAILAASALYRLPAAQAQDNADLLNKRLTVIEESIRTLQQRLDALEGKPFGTARSAGATADVAGQLAAISQKIASVEEQRKQEAVQAKAAPVVGASRDGFVLRSADGAFAFNLRGTLQADTRLFPNGSPTPGASSFTITKARPTFEGTFYKNFAFKLMPEFGSGNMVLLDGYLDATIRPWLKLRAGKFKGPVGLERLVADPEVEFYERALPTNMVPNRDVGFQLFGDISGGVVSYAAGVFNGAPDGGIAELDFDNQREFEGRVFLSPFRKTKSAPLQGLGFGVAGTAGRKFGTTANSGLAPYRTTSQVNFFRYGTQTLADGTHTRLTPQANYYYGHFGAWAEYVLSSQQIGRGTRITTADNTAWQLGATYVLTGEKASYRSVTPAKEFNLKNGTWGAFELGARYAQLAIDKSVFPLFADPVASAAGAKSWTLGINWYANKNVKFVVNYEQTRFQSAAGAPRRKRENAVLERFQLTF